MSSARHARPPRHPGFKRVLAVLLVVSLGVVIWRSGVASSLFGGKGTAATLPRASSRPSDSPSTAPSTPSPTPIVPAAEETPGPINTKFPGLTMFRGNATRTYYGEGPIPQNPKVLWRYPTTGGLCMTSSNIDGTRVWCGTGWTGQPNVIPHPSGKIEIREGAYDGHYHFLNGKTGKPMRPDLVTGDLAKGSASTDPDGFPLYYGGSRDNLLRVVALDRKTPTVLWSFNSNSQPGGLWNDDWDGDPLIIGDYMLEGSENSWFYVVRLHRRYDAKGLVQVDPKIVMRVPGWDQQLLNDLGDHDVSIENSVAFLDGVVYFSNSGGLVQGWDISDILKGGTHYEQVLRWWDGDETDASIVIDDQGYLYVSRHKSFNIPNRTTTRDHQIGSLMKLNPRKPNHPLVWSVQVGGFELDGGILGTPALYKGVVYVMDTAGALVAVDQKKGKILWEYEVPGPTWNSPVAIDDQVLFGDCAGYLHDMDVTDPKAGPKEIWKMKIDGSCVESTPAVWKGMIYVGTRGGAIYGIGDK